MSSKIEHIFQKLGMGVRERIIYALEKSKKTRQALADELGIGRGAVSDMLNKDGDLDSIKYLEACERVTGFSFEWLRTGTGPEKIQNLSIAREPEGPQYGSEGLNELTRLRMMVNKLTGENDAFREVIKIITGRTPPERQEDKPVHDGTT